MSVMHPFSATRGLVVALIVVIAAGISLVAKNTSPVFAAEATSTKGTDFWVTFDVNAGRDTDLRLYLASDAAASVDIAWPDGSDTTHAVAPGSVTTVAGDSYADSYVNSSSQGTAANGIHITSDVDITVYGASIAGSTSDAFVAIPTPSLGTDYRLLSHPLTIGSYPGRFSVIAAESGSTTLTITPSVGLAGGQSADSSFTVSLAQGEVFTSESVSTGGADLTGTRIESTQKVVVTSGVECVNTRAGSCDFIVQYLPPSASWGKAFVLPGSSNTTSPDRYRVVAAEDSTSVSIDGSVVASLDAGDAYQFDPSGSNAQQTQVLEADKPVLVGQFLGAGNYGGTSGDPAFSLITPSLQFLTSYNFATPASEFSTHFLTVVAKTDDTSSVSAPGLTLGAFSAVSGSTYSVSRTAISAGSYSIEADSGIGIYVSGFNPANSYSYPGGFAVVDLIENPGGVEEVESGGDPEPSGGDSSPSRDDDDDDEKAAAVLPAEAPTPQTAPRSAEPAQQRDEQEGTSLEQDETPKRQAQTSKRAEVKSSPSSIDSGSGIEFGRATASPLIGQDSARRSIQALSNEGLKGFLSYAPVKIEVRGAYTGARFVASARTLDDPERLMQAVVNSARGEAGSPLQIETIAFSERPTQENLVAEPTDSALELFRGVGINPPATLSPDERAALGNKGWLQVSATLREYQPGSEVYLVVTSQPLIVGSGTVGRDGTVEILGGIPIGWLETGEHRIRAVGVREFDGIQVDVDGNLSIPPQVMQKISAFDIGTQVTVLASGPNPQGGEHLAIRVVPLEPDAPWWTLWILAGAFVLMLFTRIRGVLATRSQAVVGGFAVLIAAIPGVVLGWTSTVTIVAVWAAILGVLGTILLVVIPSRGANSIRPRA